jgi:DNA polymerase-1
MKGLKPLKQKTLLLIDGHGLVFRAFFALPQMNAPDGTPTNAVLGFANMYLKVLQDLVPGNVAVCFDSPFPSFRKGLFPEYKEGRHPTPEAFKPQLPLVKEFLQLLGCPVLEQEGVEADDLLATVAEKASLAGLEVVILTADKDFLQLLKPGVSLIKPLKGISEFETLDVASFSERFGFSPEFFTTWLSLTGDSVDNIPGVPGVGEKTASSLVQKFPTLEILFENLRLLPPKLAEKIESSKERLRLNMELVVLKKDYPFELDQLVHVAPKTALLEKWTRALGLKQLARRLQLEPQKEEKIEPQAQGTLPLGEVDVESGSAGLGKVLSAPPFGLSFIANQLPARKSEIAGACLASSGGSFTIFSSASPLSAPVLERILDQGPLVVCGLKELCSATGWEPKDYSRLTDNRVARYLLHPEITFTGAETLEASLTSSAFRILSEAPSFSEKLRDLGLDTLARTIDMPLAPVLARLEQYGIGTDPTALAHLSGNLKRRIEQIASEIAEKAGVMINLNSPQQVAGLLFDKLGLGVLKKKKTGPSTDASVLETLALDPLKGVIPRLLLEHRESSKLLTGFVEAFLKLVEPSTGAIHSTFDSLATATGRLSSRDPNVQNLPQFGDWAGKFRKCFVPRGEGRVFLSADYSQIELRVLAHLCGDEKLRGAFESGRDIHTETASWVFNVHPSLVTPDLRRAAKAVNFGLLYGMSSHGLGQRLGVGRNQAQAMIDRYFSALPSVKDYLENTVLEAQRQGWTRSFFGRIRPLSEVSMANGRGADAIRRIALNTPIQSAAADVAKLAMIAYSRTEPALDGRHPLVLQVHDSLVCECPEEDVERTSAILRETMENAVRLSVPLTVDIKQGGSFADI